jgi:hypothetical protein
MYVDSNREKKNKKRSFAGNKILTNRSIKFILILRITVGMLDFILILIINYIILNIIIIAQIKISFMF